LWSPISATLISGERDAVLVDALMTSQQAEALGDAQFACAVASWTPIRGISRRIGTR
jgi:hypothetical protein